MAEKTIADKADIIINGYAFTREDDGIHVLNLNSPDKAVVFTPMSNRDAGLRPMDSGAGKKPITCEPASQGLMQMLFSIKDLKTVNVSKNGIRTSFNDLEILENETYRKKCKARLKVDIKYDDARNFYDFVKS